MPSDSGRQTKRCEPCNGEGWIVPDDAYNRGTKDNVKCTACNGEGFVYVD